MKSGKPYRNSKMQIRFLVNRRHSKERKTPVPIYIGLKLYASHLANTIIEELFSLGICISYDMCVDFSNNIAVPLLEKYERDGVFIGSARLDFVPYC